MHLPGRSEGGDEGWQPTSHAMPRLSQMGQSSVTSRDFLDASNSSLVARHPACGMTDLIACVADMTSRRICYLIFSSCLAFLWRCW